MSPAQQIFQAGSLPGIPTTATSVQPGNTYPVVLGNQNLANPINGFTTLAGLGLAYAILMGIGSTRFYGIAYGIEILTLLGLALDTNGTQLFTGFSSFLKGALG